MYCTEPGGIQGTYCHKDKPRYRTHCWHVPFAGESRFYAPRRERLTSPAIYGAQPRKAAIFSLDVIHPRHLRGRSFRDESIRLSSAAPISENDDFLGYILRIKPSIMPHGLARLNLNRPGGYHSLIRNSSPAMAIFAGAAPAPLTLGAPDWASC